MLAAPRCSYQAEKLVEQRPSQHQPLALHEVAIPFVEADLSVRALQRSVVSANRQVGRQRQEFSHGWVEGAVSQFVPRPDVSDDRRGQRVAAQDTVGLLPAEVCLEVRSRLSQVVGNPKHARGAGQQLTADWTAPGHRRGCCARLLRRGPQVLDQRLAGVRLDRRQSRGIGSFHRPLRTHRQRPPRSCSLLSRRSLLRTR